MGQVLRRQFLLAASALLASPLVAEAPPQVRTISPDLFVGKWEGEWYDSSGLVGGLDVTIRRPRNGTLPMLVRAPSTNWGGFGAKAKFVNGEVVVDQPNLRIILVFRLRGNDRLEADYHYRDASNTGTWSLVRKKRDSD